MAKKDTAGQTGRIRISNETLNCYGFWLVTAGAELDQYRKNPVLLLMHERGNIIGWIDDIQVEGDEITGVPHFDEASEASIRAKKQWELGSLRMCSAGLEIIETSEDPKLLKPGQTAPTVTRWRLIEVSMVDIGANPDAIRLYKNGAEVTTLAAAGLNPLPQINKPEKIMELKKLALMLGLTETATEQEVIDKINELIAHGTEASTLRAQVDAMNLSAITVAVDAAIAEKKLGADRKDQFVELGKKVGLDELKKTLEAMAPAVKLSQTINPGAAPAGKSEYKKLSEVPADELKTLREENVEEYKRLYKAEYGFSPEI